MVNIFEPCTTLLGKCISGFQTWWNMLGINSFDFRGVSGVAWAPTCRCRGPPCNDPPDSQFRLVRVILAARTPKFESCFLLPRVETGDKRNHLPAQTWHVKPSSTRFLALTFGHLGVSCQSFPSTVRHDLAIPLQLEPPECLGKGIDLAQQNGKNTSSRKILPLSIQSSRKIQEFLCSM